MVDVETWVCGRCDRAMAGNGYCWPCGPTVRASVLIPDRHPGDAGYYSAGRKVKPEWPPTDPPPVAVNTAPRPEGAPVDPRAVLGLQQAAQRAGWAVRTGYSRGPLRTPSPGRYKDVEVIGVWGLRGHGRFHAGYYRTVGAKSGWTWDVITAWDSASPRRTLASITALKEAIA